MLKAGVAAFVLTSSIVATPAQAQGWRDGRSCWGLEGRDRERCERDSQRGYEQNRNERERQRRKDAKAEGVVAGVVGAAVLGAIIASAANDKNKNRERDRREYCERRYGEYDARSDSYRASNGVWYPCR